MARKPHKKTLRRTRALLLESLEERRLLADLSFPPILQWFESSYDTIENRTADAFMAGYGSIYTPPPGRADQGNLSVGYDQYDRFDLGRPGNPTMYGTETGLKTAVDLTHRAGMDYYVDFVLNHNGYSNLGSTDGNGNSFYDAGGYPGVSITLPNDVDGDFNSAFDWGDVRGRLAGLLDINHAKNYRFIRNPVEAGNPENIRAGTQYAYGRIANVPDANNRRFYPDTNLEPIIVFDPMTGESDIRVYPFNLGDPMAGDASAENVTGYLMRNAQWLAQTVGIDGFRLDAAKHMEGFSLDFFDRSVYRSSFRNLLDGSQKHIFSFSEVYDGNQDYLQTFIKKTINPNDPGRVGGNRDTLDFPLHFALRDNLTGNGFQNSWYGVRDATLDLHDDGFHNGSQGVMFSGSHDDFGAHLNNVAQAYVLMHPGNAVVYFNGKEFGDNRDFPKDGRGDALGGQYGEGLTRLVTLRETHGRGNYIERWIEKENFAFERQGSSVVMLSNRVDPGYDGRTLHTSFAPGTPLIELTGNAASSSADPFNDIPELVTVNGDGTINVRFLRNMAPGTSNFTGNGYLVYGLATPQGSLSLSNVTSTLAGGTPTPATNGTTRLASHEVISADSFEVRLQTNPVNLLGFYRDAPADGDNALLRIDGGIDVNGNGHVDFTQAFSAAYGFEEFLGKRSPLWGGGDGEFRQSVDATKLAEGVHFIEARAFRHREPNEGEAVFTPFKKTIYIDRLPPNSAIASFDPFVSGVNENRQVQIRSVDKTADAVHVFLDLPASLSRDEILSRVNAGNRAGEIDRDLFAYGYNGLGHGNHVLTVVTYEQTGNVNVQRFPARFTATIVGAGLGDATFDGTYSPDDVNAFRSLYLANNTQFNAAADLNGDGLIDGIDIDLLGPRLTEVNADAATKDAYRQLLIDTRSASIGGVVFRDDDGNGVRGANETVRTGVTVELVVGSTVQGTRITDSLGFYRFDALVPGNYVIRVQRPTGATFSPLDAGSDDFLDSDVNPLDGATSPLALSGVSRLNVGAGILNLAPSLAISGSVTYTENKSPILLAPNAAAADADSADFGGGRLRVFVQQNASADDRLSIRSTGVGIGQIGVSGNKVTYGGTSIGTFSGGSGATPLVIELNASANLLAVQALTRAIAFRVLGDKPSTARRTLHFELFDGDGAVSAPVTKAVNVIEVNDLPVLSLSGSTGYRRNKTAIVVAPTGTARDRDADHFNGGVLTVRIAAGAEATNRLEIGGRFTLQNDEIYLGSLLIARRNSGGGVGLAELVLTFTDKAKQAEVQELLRSITFRTIASQSNAARVVEFQLTDGLPGGTGSKVSKTILVRS